MSKTFLVLAFLAANWLAMATYVSVILHRSLAHRAVLMPRWFVELVTSIANLFFIYVNPRVWVAEHRLHHAHSDTEKDPDKQPGWSLLRFTWWSITNPAGPRDEHVAKISQDKCLNTPLMKLWSEPAVGLVCQFGTGFTIPWLIMRAALPALAIWFLVRAMGITVKMIQGYFSHSLAYGYRNFDTADNSSNLNGRFATFMSAGESLQNNHHARPTSPIHAFKEHERDPGFVLVRLYERMGLAWFPQKSTMTPIPEVVPA